MKAKSATFMSASSMPTQSEADMELPDDSFFNSPRLGGFPACVWGRSASASTLIKSLKLSAADPLH